MLLFQICAILVPRGGYYGRKQARRFINGFCGQNIKAPSNTLFQIRKSSSSIYANIREANYGQSKFDMVSKFEIALKECSETEGWLKLLFNTNAIDEETFKTYRNLCGRIRRMLIASCKTLKENI